MTTVAEKVNIGIIGAGDHSTQSHVMYLAQMPDLCKVVALADLSTARMERLDEQFSLNADHTKDWNEVVENPEVDAVFVMTPDKFHTVQLLGAIANGKHVFCEKPLATTDREYKKLANGLGAAREDNIVVSTCHPRRFDPPFVALHDWVKNPESLAETFNTTGGLGKPMSFEFGFQYHKPSKEGLHRSLMDDHLNHELDAMHFLLGKNGIDHAVKHFESETEFHVSGERHDGISFSFIGSRKLDEKIYPERMRITFEKGSLEMDMFQGIAVLGLAGQLHTRQNERFKTNYPERFHAINEHFLRCVRGEEETYISTEEMLINTKLAIDLADKTFVNYK